MMGGHRYARSKESGANVSNKATNGMDSKDVESIVRTQEVLQLRRVVACSATDDTEDDGRPWRDVSGAGRDGNETSNNTRAETDGRPLLLQSVIDQAPRDSTNAGSQVGDNSRNDSSHVSAQGRTGVEAEPANPQEDSAKNDLCDIMRTVVELLGAMAPTFTEHVRVCKCCRAGGNMHWRATSKIETAHLEGPTRRIPSPACDRVIYDCTPNKHVDDAGEDASTLCYGTYCKRDSDGCEHSLIDGEKKIGNSGASN